MTMFNFNGRTYKAIEVKEERPYDIYDVFVRGYMTVKAVPLPTCYPKSGIGKVIHNEPATIVIWADGSKTVVKCSPNDEYDREKGLLMCIAKKQYGSKAVDILREWCR